MNVTNPNFFTVEMPCETHRIYDKINSILTGLHGKYKDHENLVTLNAVVQIKLYGVRVHVQVCDKVRRCTVVDTTLRIRNEKELSFVENMFENCELALAIVLDQLEGDLPEVLDCFIVEDTV